jgi:hypothetical protein
MDAYYYSGLKDLVISMLNMDDISDETFEKAVDMNNDLEYKDDVYETLTGRHTGRCNEHTAYMIDHGKMGWYPTLFDREEAIEFMESDIELMGDETVIRKVTYER